MIDFLKITYTSTSPKNTFAKLDYVLQKQKIESKGFKILETENTTILPLSDNDFIFEISDIAVKIIIFGETIGYEFIVFLLTIKSIEWVGEKEPTNFLKRYMIDEIKKNMDKDWNNVLKKLVS